MRRETVNRAARPNNRKRNNGTRRPRVIGMRGHQPRTFVPWLQTRRNIISLSVSTERLTSMTSVRGANCRSSTDGLTNERVRVGGREAGQLLRVRTAAESSARDRADPVRPRRHWLVSGDDDDTRANFKSILCREAAGRSAKGGGALAFSVWA